MTVCRACRLRKQKAYRAGLSPDRRARNRLGMVAWRFGLTSEAVAQEHQSTAESAFRQLVVSAHAFADVGGWTVVALLAVTVLIVSAVLWQAGRRSVLALVGFALFFIALLLFILDSSYLFLLLFGLWEIGMAAALMIWPREWRAT